MLSWAPFLGDGDSLSMFSKADARLPTSLWPRLCRVGGGCCCWRGELDVLESVEKREEAVELEASE